jgi:hypothetical protein
VECQLGCQPPDPRLGNEAALAIASRIQPSILEEVNADGIEFDWDEANMRHIARHGVTPEEAEEAVTNDPLELAGCG